MLSLGNRCYFHLTRLYGPWLPAVKNEPGCALTDFEVVFPSGRMALVSGIGAGRLHLSLAAIHDQFGTIDETTVVRGQKQHRFGDLVRLPRPPQRDLRHHVRNELFDLLLAETQLRENRCHHDAGTDRVDTDFAILQIDRPAASQLADSRLSCGVNAER